MKLKLKAELLPLCNISKKINERLTQELTCRKPIIFFHSSSPLTHSPFLLCICVHSYLHLLLLVCDRDLTHYCSSLYIGLLHSHSGDIIRSCFSTYTEWTDFFPHLVLTVCLCTMTHSQKHPYWIFSLLLKTKMTSTDRVSFLKSQI